MPGRSPRRGASAIPFALVAGALVVVLGLVAAVRAWTDGSTGASPTSPGTTAVATSPTASSPPTPSTAVSSPTSLPSPPRCGYGDEPTRFDALDQWDRTLLDTTFRIDRTYVPPDLDGAVEAGFPEGGLLIRSLIVEDLRALGQAAASAGHPVELIAAYRTFEQQADLFDRRVDELGEEEALAKTARAGHSEHQLGTTVDFKDPGALDVTAAWGATPTGMWIRENAWRFGFVESYPEGKDGVTCYAYEPWHYRYLGRDVAAGVQASGLTLREYLWAWQETGTAP
jgi:D-alanyl-D-alanine carboxypeptidase